MPRCAGHYTRWQENALAAMQHEMDKVRTGYPAGGFRTPWPVHHLTGIAPPESNQAHYEVPEPAPQVLNRDRLNELLGRYGRPQQNPKTGRTILRLPTKSRI